MIGYEVYSLWHMSCADMESFTRVNIILLIHGTDAKWSPKIFFTINYTFTLFFFFVHFFTWVNATLTLVELMLWTPLWSQEWKWQSYHSRVNLHGYKGCPWASLIQENLSGAPTCWELSVHIWWTLKPQTSLK